MALTVGELNAYLDVDQSGFTRGITAAEAKLAGFQRDAEGRLHDLEGRFVKEGEEADKGFGSGLGKGAGGFGGTLEKILGSVAAVGLSVGKLSGGAAAFLTLARAAGSFVAALAPAAPAVLASPAAFVVAKTAMAAFSVATEGVGAAMSAIWTGDAKKLEKAMKDLSPAARAFVEEAAKFGPASKALKSEVQDTFFKPLINDVAELGSLYLPVVKRGFIDLAATMNDGAQALPEWAQQKSMVADVGTIFDSTRTIVSTLMSALRPAAQALMDLIVPALPLLELGAHALRDWTVALSCWKAEARQSSAFSEMFPRGGDTSAQFGRIGRNVANIIGSFFRAMSGASESASALDTIEKITDKLAHLAATDAGQLQAHSVRTDVVPVRAGLSLTESLDAHGCASSRIRGGLPQRRGPFCPTRWFAPPARESSPISRRRPA